jgi:tetratricopeptide (TPR) repeat protein
VPDAAARRLFARALKAGEARDYEKAAQLLTAVLAQTDSIPEALLFLGRARHALGEHGLAIDAFRQYLADRSNGNAAAGFFFLGRSYLACGRFQAAAACLRRSAQLEPGRPQPWAILGAALLKLHRTKAAMDCLERAVNLAPNDRRIYRGYLNVVFARGVRLLARGNADLARQLLGFAIDNGLDGTASRLWRARVYRELGRPAEALADCEAALEHAPDDTSIRWLRAGLLLASGRQAEAMAEFDSIRSSDPSLPTLPSDDRSLARLRASVAFRDERWKEAVSTSLALLRAEPEDAPLRAIVAESLRSLGELERSKNHWHRAVEADPESPELRLGLALALWDSGEYAEALRAVERARRLGADPGEADYYAALCRARLGEDPAALVPVLQSLLRSRTAATGEADPRLMFALGEALYRSGRPDLAAAWFEKVLSLSPEHELSLLYRISSAESVGDGTALAAAYEGYLARYPDNAKIRHEYVNVLIARRAWEGASRQLEAGLAFSHPGASSRRLLAACYRNAGRYREAAVAYRDLLRADPSSGELLVSLAFCLDKDGKSDYALALLEKAPEAAKAGSASWMLQGMLAARAGKQEAAVDALRKATEIAPDSERAWRNLGLLYRGMGLVDFEANCLERAEILASSAGAANAGVSTRAPARDAGKAPAKPAAETGRR